MWKSDRALGFNTVTLISEIVFIGITMLALRFINIFIFITDFDLHKNLVG